MIERLNRLGLCQQEQETLIWKASRFQDLKRHFYALSLSLSIWSMYGLTTRVVLRRLQIIGGKTSHWPFHSIASIL